MSLKLEIIWNKIKGLMNNPLKSTEEKKINDTVDTTVLAIDEIADSYIEIIGGIKKTLKDHVPTIKKIIRDNEKEIKTITTAIKTISTNLKTIAKTSNSDIETIADDLIKNTENGGENIISTFDALLNKINNTPKRNKTLKDEMAEIDERVELALKKNNPTTKWTNLGRLKTSLNFIKIFINEYKILTNQRWKWRKLHFNIL